MPDSVEIRTPIHLWIVGILSLLWNAYGCYDYLMVRTRNEAFFEGRGMDPKEILTFIDGFPLWAQFGWGFQVWGGLLAAVLLLARHRWAVWAYAASLIGTIVSYANLLTGPPLPGSEQFGAMNYVLPVVIVILVPAQYFYARAMEKKGVLR